MQDHLLVSTYNQGLSDKKQLTDNIDEANQWCTIAIVTMRHFTINVKESFTMSKNVYHQYHNTIIHSEAKTIMH
jgi:hypothetical protein